MKSGDPLRYRRGYVVFEKGATPFLHTEPVIHWEAHDLGTHSILHDPLLPFHQLIEGELFLLGTAWHVKGDSVLKALTEAYVTSFSDFLDELDYVAGRYIVLYRHEGELHVTQDALGLRSVFYSSRFRCMSSHYHLLREIISEKKPNEIVLSLLKRKVTNNMIPGHFTPDEQILMLTPNQSMSLETFEWKRIFPRGPYIEQSVEAATNEIEQATRKLLGQIDSRLLVPITAGLDSRTTIALLRCEGHHQYFTYGLQSVKSHTLDLQVAEEIARAYRLPHVRIPLKGDFGKDEDERRFMTYLRKVTIRRHSFEVAWQYYHHFSDDYLHIRSNGYEIGRKYYRQAFSLTEAFSVTDIARTFSRTAALDKDVIALTEKFLTQANLSASWNYDPYDLYYWEHRMGTWHTSLLHESDLAHDSFVLINARHILKQFLSVSSQSQLEGAVQRNLIRRFHEPLLGIKINGQ